MQTLALLPCVTGSCLSNNVSQWNWFIGLSALELFLNCLTENCPLRLLSFNYFPDEKIDKWWPVHKTTFNKVILESEHYLSELLYLFLRKTIELHHLLHAIASVHNDVRVCWRELGQTGWKFTVLSLLNKHHHGVITLGFTVVDFSIQSNPHKQPLLYSGHFFGEHSIHSPLFQPLYNGHLSTMAAFFCTKVAVVVGRFNCSVLTGLIGTYFPLKVNGAFCHSVSYLNQMPSSTVECSQKVTSCSPGKYKQSPRDVNFGTGFFCLLSMFHIRHYQNLKIDFDG